MSNYSEDAMTKPTLQTVLEGINALGDNLQGQIIELHAEFGSLRTEFGSLDTEVRDDISALRTEFYCAQKSFQCEVKLVQLCRTWFARVRQFAHWPWIMATGALMLTF